MKVYSHSEARQKLSGVINKAENSRKILIHKKNGQTFALTPEKTPSCLLNVLSIKAHISTQEIVDTVREGREH